MPWLQLEKDILWFSRGRQILALKRRPNSIATVPALCFKPHKEDVSRFIVKNGMVVSGGRWAVQLQFAVDKFVSTIITCAIK